MQAQPIVQGETAQGFKVAEGVWGLKDIFVNMYVIADTNSDNWVLVDAGLKSSAKNIKKLTESLFGTNAAPAAILLTHAHFDHVGSLKALAQEWGVPVYAHYLELPYLTGKASYPPPDPSVGGGLMSALAFLYPHTPIDLEGRANALPESGEVPFLPGWKYIHTPGHAPGHVSFFRESDGLLLAGDAFLTTCQESILSVMFQTRKISGPPKYFTYDWVQANRSVKKLEKLKPQIVAAGHGKPMEGPEMQEALLSLAVNFYEEAVPFDGRYKKEPAVADANGFLYVPPGSSSRHIAKTAITATAAVAIGFLVFKAVRKAMSS